MLIGGNNVKRKWMLGCLMLTLALAGCGTQIETEDNNTFIEEEESVVADDLKTDELSLEKEENPVVENDEKAPEIKEEADDAKKEIEMPSNDVLEEMLEGFVDYGGLILLNDGRYTTFNSLSNDRVFSMVAFSCFHKYFDQNIGMDENSGMAIFSKELFNQVLTDLFDERFANIYDEEINDACITKTQDSFIPFEGDWGLMGPRFDIVSVRPERDTILVQADYYMFNHEEGIRDESNGTMTAIYTLIPSEKSKYGYVITDALYEYAE